MPEFVNPFSGVAAGRKMTDSELTRALRLNLAAEEEAVHLYESHADATDNTTAQKVLRDIANEERVHAGEFQRLINILLEDEAGFLAEGAEEVDALIQEDEVSAKSAPPEPKAIKTVPTIGNLKQ